MTEKIIPTVFLIILIVALAASAFILNNAQRTVQKIKDDTKNTVRALTEEKLTELDFFSLIVTTEMKKSAERALRATAEACKEAARNPMTFADLEALATENGVSHIYLINSNGIIFRSTSQKDLGINLFKSTDILQRLLPELQGTGSIAHSGLTVGMVSGRPALFSYYGPKDCDIIIETAIFFEDYINNNISEEMYSYYFKNYFNGLTRSVKYVKSIDLLTKFSLSGYSFFNFKREIPLSQPLIDRIKNNDLSIQKNGLEYQYFAFNLENSQKNYKETYYAEIVYDFSSLGKGILNFAYFAIVVVLVCVSASLLFMLHLSSSRKRNSNLSPLPHNHEQTNKKIISDKKNVLFLLSDLSPKMFSMPFPAAVEYSLFFADSSVCALKLVSERQYDIIICDIQLHQTVLSEFVRSVRNEERKNGYEHIPLIAVVPAEYEKNDILFIEAGFDTFIPKPINIGALLKTVSVILGESVSEQTTVKEDESIPISINPELAESVSLFLNEVYALADKITMLLEQNNYGGIQIIGHRIKTEGKLLGLETVSDFGLYIEGKAIRKNKQRISETTEELKKYTKRIRLVFTEHEGKTDKD